MFHSGQKAVESFFKRTRFRRSKRLRASFRASFISRPNSAQRSLPTNHEGVPTITTPTVTKPCQPYEEKSQFKIKIKRKKSDRVMNINDQEEEELLLIDRTENNVVTTYNPDTNEIIKHQSNIHIDRSKLFEQFGKNKTTAEVPTTKQQMPVSIKQRPKTADAYQPCNNNSNNNINNSNNNNIINVSSSGNNNNNHRENNEFNIVNNSINTTNNGNNSNITDNNMNNNNTNNNTSNTNNNNTNNSNTNNNDASRPIGLIANSNTNQIDRTSTDQKMIELLKNEVSSLKRELKKQKDLSAKLQERLSEQARRQLEKGSTKFEDLSLGANRPTQLIKRYGNLYSEARVDALDALDDLPELTDCDDLKTKLLLSIIVLSFRSTQKTLLDMKTKVRDLLHIPRVLQSGLPHLCHAARDLEDDIGVYLRKTLDKHDLKKNYNEVSERVWATLFDYPSLRDCKGLKRYMEECVSVAWSLTVQNPPMLIDYEMCPFDQHKHSRFHTSDPDCEVIKVYLWPALTEGEKGVYVCKGIVIT